MTQLLNYDIAHQILEGKKMSEEDKKILLRPIKELRIFLNSICLKPNEILNTRYPDIPNVESVNQILKELAGCSLECYNYFECVDCRLMCYRCVCALGFLYLNHAGSKKYINQCMKH